jgi:hypothetical protein
MPSVEISINRPTNGDVGAPALAAVVAEKINVQLERAAVGEVFQGLHAVADHRYLHHDVFEFGEFFAFPRTI